MGLLEGRVEAISGEFKSQEVAMVVWSMYALLKRAPAIIMERATGILEYEVSQLTILCQFVRWSQGTSMIEQYRLHALVTRHIRLHSHTLTSQQILSLIFYTWEHTLYVDTIGDLLILWTQ